MYINKGTRDVMQIFEQNKKLSTSKIRFFHWSQAETIFLEKFNDKNIIYNSQQGDVLINMIKLKKII